MREQIFYPPLKKFWQEPDFFFKTNFLGDFYVLRHTCFYAISAIIWPSSAPRAPPLELQEGGGHRRRPPPCIHACECVWRKCNRSLPIITKPSIDSVLARHNNQAEGRHYYQKLSVLLGGWAHGYKPVWKDFFGHYLPKKVEGE